MATVKYAFRNKFKAICRETIQWYPGHMEKSFTKMQARIKQVDCVIEVHDARIPLSGRNPNFVSRLIGPKPHILVLNKRDLVDVKTEKTIVNKLSGEFENIIFTNAKYQQCRGIKQLIPRAVDLIGQSNRYNRTEEKNLKLMVIGVPNVGKSSVINALRNRILHRGKATAVGAKAGVTKSVQTEIKVNLAPPVYLVDTPGILPPKVGDDITGMKLALCSCFNDDVVGQVQIADFLLYWYNKHQLFHYVDYFHLNGPCDDIVTVLHTIANDRQLFMKAKDVSDNSMKLVADTKAAASMIVTAYRLGKLGTFSLDFPELARDQENATLKRF